MEDLDKEIALAEGRLENLKKIKRLQKESEHERNRLYKVPLRRRAKFWMRRNLTFIVTLILSYIVGVLCMSALLYLMEVW